MNPIIQYEALRHRRYLIVAFASCLMTLFVAGLLSRDFSRALWKAPGIVGLASATLLVYAFAVLRRPSSNTDDLQARSLGLKWGFAAGCSWILFFMQPLGLLLAALVPWVAGAQGAVANRRVRAGILAGFWCGVAGGLL